MEREEMRLLVIGKTGNGKSTLCNTLLGTKEFRTGCSMSSATLEAQMQSAEWKGVKVKVVDTPDPVNWDGPNRPNLAEEIQRWRAMTSPYPSAILITIRCDVRYTAEEYDVYKQIKKAWGVGFTEHLIVAFTFGDRQDRDIEQELKEVNDELKTVLKNARHRYVVSRGRMDNREELMKEIKDFVRKMDGEQVDTLPADKAPGDKSWYQDPRVQKALLFLLIAAAYMVWRYRKRIAPPPGSPSLALRPASSSGGDRDGLTASATAAGVAVAPERPSLRNRPRGLHFMGNLSWLYGLMDGHLPSFRLGDLTTNILALGSYCFNNHPC